MLRRMAATSEVIIQPSAVVVGLPSEHLVLCHEVLGDARLEVHAFDDAGLACGNIAAMLPRLVVVPATLPQDLLEMVDDAAVAVGAPLLLLYGDESYDELEERLQGAVRDVATRWAS